MIEAVKTMFESINILGIGGFVIIAGVILAVAIGMSKDRQQAFFWAIAVAGFSMLFIFNQDYTKGILFIIVAFMVIIYGIKYLGVSEHYQRSMGRMFNPSRSN